MTTKLGPHLSPEQFRWIKFNLENGEHVLNDETVQYVMITLRQHNLVWKESSVSKGKHE